MKKHCVVKNKKDGENMNFYEPQYYAGLVFCLLYYHCQKVSWDFARDDTLNWNLTNRMMSM